MREAMDRIARFFDAEYNDYDEDLPALEAYAGRAGGPILELGCGTGRALIPLAQAGFRVTGVDLSPEMLRRARAKAEAAGVGERITLIEGDYASAPLGGPYRLAFTVMNTFLHLPDQAAQLAALRHWRASLAPRGYLIIDIFNPDPGQLAALDGRVEWHHTWPDPETGGVVIKQMIRTVDLAEQIMHVTFMYDQVADNGEMRRTLAMFDLRYLWRFEAELLLDKAGYAVEAVYGSWDLAPLMSDSERLILIARRKG